MRAFRLFVFIFIAALIAGLPAYAAGSPSKSGSKPKTVKPAESTTHVEPAPLPEYKGPKQIVCIQPFEGAGKLGWDEGATLGALLTDALTQTGRFMVAERQQLDAILTEQDLGASGRINSQTALKIGQMVGASTLIQGTVTQFEPGEEGGSGRISIPIGGIGGGIAIGGSKVTSKVAMQLRMIDLTTGIVLDTYKAEATGTHKAIGLDVYTRVGSAGGDSFKNTPLGETSEQCVQDAVRHIVEKMAAVPFSCRVAEVDGKTIYINAGSNRNMYPGAELTCLKQGKVITDPDTGLTLDVQMTEIGLIKVDSVQEKMSTCSLLTGDMPSKGDTLKLKQ